MTKIAGSGSINQRHGFPDPDPYQNGSATLPCCLMVPTKSDSEGNLLCNVLDTDPYVFGPSRSVII